MALKGDTAETVPPPRSSDVVEGRTFELGTARQTDRFRSTADRCDPLQLALVAQYFHVELLTSRRRVIRRDARIDRRSPIFKLYWTYILAMGDDGGYVPCTAAVVSIHPQSQLTFAVDGVQRG